eukprot:TRINITY_DN1831_c0_g1_i1.p1 TRINITY_DN1831_c0_g1~~TRINITY_DN1831_c0_g1_i1.p1  ORF type:complete len:174 (-),score=22.63 TRINITY_DN1831_c0_g1_i1:828-1349(-)
MAGVLKSVREAFSSASDEPVIPEEPSFLNEISASCTISRQERLYAFVSCVTLGIFCVLLSLFNVLRPIKFAITYTFGNLLAVAGTGLLVGFHRQLQLMFDRGRIVASSIYLVSIFATLMCALKLHDSLLTLLCVLVQFTAFIWYTLSYIPFAQAAAKKLLNGRFDMQRPMLLS